MPWIGILKNWSTLSPFSMFCKNKLFQLQWTKLEQFSVIALLKRRQSTWQFSILSSLRIVFRQKNMPQIIKKKQLI